MENLSKEQLLEENKKLSMENKMLREDNARLNHEMTLLRQKMDLVIRRMFGKSSEKLNADQLELFILNLGDNLGKGEASSLQEADPTKSVGKSRSGSRRERWPSDLPVVEEVIEPAEVVAAPQDWRLIGEEVSEQLDYQPGKFLRRRLVRRKYVHRMDRQVAPVIAPMPEVLLERCIAAPGLLAAIIVGKYCDHLPLYRQERIFENRHGVYLPRASMSRWMGMAADWLQPIYEIVRTGVMGGGYVQVDERSHRAVAT